MQFEDLNFTYEKKIIWKKFIYTQETKTATHKEKEIWGGKTED